MFVTNGGMPEYKIGRDRHGISIDNVPVIACGHATTMHGAHIVDPSVEQN